MHARPAKYRIETSFSKPAFVYAHSPAGALGNFIADYENVTGFSYPSAAMAYVKQCSRNARTHIYQEVEGFFKLDTIE